MISKQITLLHKWERGKQLKFDFEDNSIQIEKFKPLGVVSKTLLVVIMVSVLFSAHFALAYDGNMPKLVTWLNTEQDPTILQDEQSQEPVTPVAPIQEPDRVVRSYWMPVTAYSSTPDQTDSSPFITANGTRVREGIIAANFLPFGTKVKIPSMFGDRVFVVQDRMNARYWHRVDIWMPTRAQALQFGVRTLQIEIIQET